MKKIVSALLFLGIVHLQADFIAFKKFTNSETGKTIYMLYDIHVSFEKNPIPIETRRKHIASLQREMSRLFGQMLEHSKDKVRRAMIEQEKDTLTKQYAELFRKKHLPNLYKQQNDLLALVKQCGLSLVNEDWRDITADEDYDANAKKEIQFLLGQRSFAKKQNRRNVTPMQGIGEKLTGMYTENKLNLVPGPEDVYYYNAEVRSGPSIDPGKEAHKVDDQIMKGIEKILEDEGKDSVVVSAGASHGGRISEILTTKKGYKGGELITDSGLTGWFAPRRLKEIIEDLKNNKEPELTGLNDNIQYRFASHPIDLKKVFAKELPECQLSTDALEAFEHEITDFVRNLFK